jgi:hypothetical protein
MSLLASAKQVGQQHQKGEAQVAAKREADWVAQAVKLAETATGGLVTVEVLESTEIEHPRLIRSRYGGQTIGRNRVKYVRVKLDDVVARIIYGAPSELRVEVPCSCGCGQAALTSPLRGYGQTNQEIYDKFVQQLGVALTRERKCYWCDAQVPPDPCPTCGRK